MKKFLLSAVLVTSALSYGINKMPLTIKNINSNAYNEYAIVYTTIRLNPKEVEKETGKAPVPKITRELIGSVVGTEQPEYGKYRIQNINRKITIPMQQISKDHEKEIAVLTSKLAGKLGNAIATGFDKKELGKKIEASAEITGAIAEWGLQVAAEKLSEFYGMNETELNLIEILPTKYYKVSDDDITITPAFTQDFEKFMNLKNEYKQLVQDYNKNIREYQQAVGDCRDSLQMNVPQCEKAVRMEEEIYLPLLDKKIAIEEQIKNMALQRFAIMPSFRDPGNGCSKITSTGPWGITINTYVGARQTNSFNVDYCVRNPDSTDQNISIEIRGDRRDRETNKYISGGLAFTADGQTVSLPRNIGQGEPRWDSQISNQFNWYDTMLTKEESGTIKDYLIPFDVLELKKEAAELYRKKRTERFEKLLADIDKYGDKFNSGDTDDQDLLDQDSESKPKKDGESKKSPLEEKRDEILSAIGNSITQAFPKNKLLDKTVNPSAFDDMKQKVLDFIRSSLPKDDRQFIDTTNTAINELNVLLSQLIQYVNSAAQAAQAKNWDLVRGVINTIESSKFSAKFDDVISSFSDLKFTAKEKNKEAIKKVITEFATKLKPIAGNIKTEYSTKHFQQ